MSDIQQCLGGQRVSNPNLLLNCINMRKLVRRKGRNFTIIECGEAKSFGLAEGNGLLHGGTAYLGAVSHLSFS